MIFYLPFNSKGQESNSSRIYILRPFVVYGGLITYEVSINSNFISKLKSNSLITVNLTSEGLAHIELKENDLYFVNAASFNINVVRGRDYYIKVTAGTYGYCTAELMNPSTAKDLIDNPKKLKNRFDYEESSDEPILIQIPNQTTIANNAKATGTGFAISSKGLISTCNHVIENASTIKILGINGDFKNTHSAKVISSDKKNDLAILEITDDPSLDLGELPYSLKYNSDEVGKGVFVLGYPLLATMGSEIKLTTGVISSRSGFQNDQTCYQVSAAIQPGNSGGPLFDSEGNVIGVVNAKHLDAENVSYAVKLSYLYPQLLSLNTDIPFLNSNKLLNKDLPNQVKVVKDFVYIILINF